ncbi:MAG: hypothetical protein Q4B96_05270 [Bacillota bacterium]|nr:hypothetical protein [Bacillota bacterium]
MQIELAMLLSALTVFFAGFAALSANRRASRKENIDAAAREATIITKLDGIKEGQVELRTDVKAIHSEMSGIAERLVAVEQSVKSAHQRLDRAKVSEVQQCASE